jgi:hypothetical protein
MHRHHGGFLADWHDDKGKRHRKSFKSKQEALRFEQLRQAEAAKKKARAVLRSAASPSRGPKHGRKITTEKPRPTRSRATRATSTHATSPQTNFTS